MQGEQGIQGPKGDQGDPASIKVNGGTYTRDASGLITLPDYPNEVAWGNIQGTLSDQTDLQTALNSKVTTNTEQTITGKKTFNEKVVFGNEKGEEGGIIYGRVFSNPEIATPSITVSSRINKINPYNSYISLLSSSSKYESSAGPEIIFRGIMRPLNDGLFDIGTGIDRIKDLYISGNLTDGRNKISVANIASKSEIPTKTSQLTNDSDLVTSTELSTVATSGSYNDLTDKPTITNVSGVNDGTNWTSLTIGSDTYGLDGGGGPVNWSDILNKPTFATVATSGSYNDLTDKPTIPTTTSELTNNSGFITSAALNGYATEAWVEQKGYLTSVAWEDVTGKPTLATVATSGSYNDLSDKPTIPTTTGELTNNSGFITSAALNGYATET